MIITQSTLHNFLSHSDTHLDLHGVSLAVITGQNGHGKSALIDAITWALFGKGRGEGVDDFVRLGEKEARVEIQFLLRDQTYRVTRTRSSASQKTMLGFDVLSGEAWKPLAGRTVSETQEKIESCLSMDYQTLVNSCVLVQGNSDEFSKQTPGKRKEVLSRILGLEVYEKASAKARERARTGKAELAATESMIAGKRQELTAKDAIDTELCKAWQGVSFLQDEIKKAGERVEQLRAEKESAVTATTEANAIAEQSANLTRLISTAEAELSGLKQRMDQAETFLSQEPIIRGRAERYAEVTAELKAMTDVQSRVNALKIEEGKESNLAAHMDHERKTALFTAANDMQAKRSEAESTIKVIEQRLSTATQQSSLLNDLPCAGNELQNSCQLLRSALDSRNAVESLGEQLAGARDKWEVDAARLQANIETAKGESAKPNPHWEKCAELQRQVADLRFDEDKYVKSQRLAEELEGFPVRLGEMASRREQWAIDQLTQAKRSNEYQSLVAQRAVLSERLAALQPQMDALHRLIGELQVAEQTLGEARGRLSTLERSTASLEAQKHRLEAVAAEIEASEKAMEDKRAQVTLYNRVSDVLGKNGVQAFLIEKSIPRIEATANNLLSRLTDSMTLALETQAEKKSGGMADTLDIVLSDEMGRRPYESYSGGERFRVDFALRLALSKLLAERAGARLETLIIDEGFGSQDAEGLARLVECLQAVQEDFKLILVVSHVDELRDQFPVQIRVTKGQAGSTVQVVSN